MQRIAHQQSLFEVSDLTGLRNPSGLSHGEAVGVMVSVGVISGVSPTRK